jgi:hypothetical protein
VDAGAPEAREQVSGQLPARLDCGVGMALQRGSLGTDDISAWAGAWQLR